jgi:hypothetical protein
VPEPGVGAAQLGRHVRMPHGEPLDVHLVDDRVGVAAPERAACAADVAQQVVIGIAAGSRPADLAISRNAGRCARMSPT